ncbi:phosphoribosylformylglycinamidine synthase-like isoform X12 [Myiozetetes cayanensis]|uniref:phosphoribosylformylglycinamidine synthase-like isoform X5 n=2 Tax=Myiozetetes cayanensis TaxID=478635 RepID=UPI00215FBA82|nr:phosphoribosylformylglycinamidine synthase-like isoform X5 [Myiozetetes cayanensis]XP_050184201.1 phosphoribosylformylglycinamidine synthase-like isoform X6 [Myiozetetes cayanensis]XP_050184203.1 phosphoribosylformylglycinamidine synthase-like isoform X8 [Myiozetetes cayanensis]XP_050184204.1 phosphoribosylformylglycinamidine synthase-like isoform X9 [Myiozetetes cayanensis]XP_050184205.1 phosphoribosylformylglycinamidine synthase-like isoform X10 [Myiozetetes cayanensis]XP_050184206.1 phos
MALLGWVGPQTDGGDPAVVLTPNVSGRFESRFVTVRVEPGPALMLRGMEGSTLGVWVAHGEGRFQFRPPHSVHTGVSLGCNWDVTGLSQGSLRAM